MSPTGLRSTASCRPALAQGLAILATAAEFALGVGLLLGVARRPIAWASAGLLALFASGMTLSFGVKAPLNYSVFADAAAALLLATSQAVNSPDPR